ncbi:MAG: hypothetical protein RR553_07135 [Akkermansia sp.]
MALSCIHTMKISSKNSALRKAGTCANYLAMEAHTWKERTDEGTIFYRACHYAGKWTLESAPKVGRAEKDDVEWTSVEWTRDLWITLRDLLWRKYQRKRCPWHFIEEIDKLLEDMPQEPEESDEAETSEDDDNLSDRY